jgi:hypothetical protein
VHSAPSKGDGLSPDSGNVRLTEMEDDNRKYSKTLSEIDVFNSLETDA